VIASLDGLVSAVFADSLILEVGGVGYRVFCAPSVLASCSTSARARLFTHHLVREDVQALYGFRTPEELGFFGLLLTVTGVGPKVALAIVGSRPVGDLQLAILSEDQALLTAVPGVGKRLAARVILELREKVAAAGVAAAAAGGDRATGAGETEVVAALLALGYSAAEARQASRDALADPKLGAGLEERVKAALRTLLRG
jgi:Holliday junction DNA helicase RuvA